MTRQRPELKNLVNPNTLDTEVFQNKVIRPIIKMQNDLIIRYFRYYAESRKLTIKSLPEQRKRKIVESAMNKDIPFKNFLIGIVVGHFNLSELESYLLNISEYNRRIKQIIIQRILDQSTILSP